MTKPNFFIIGAPKCGTETVSHWLQGHSECFLPSDRPVNYHATDLTDRLSSEDYYLRRFAGASAPAVGEVSPWYLFSAAAVPRVLDECPEARFIVCLRNPVEMAWVLHSAGVADGREQVRDFGVAWAMSHLRRQGRGTPSTVDARQHDYTLVCALGQQLLRLTSLVRADRIHLVFLDDLLSDASGTWEDLQAFLDLSREDRADFPVEDFLVERPSPALHALIARLRDTRRALLPQHLVRPGFLSRVNGWNRRAGTLDEMPDHFREKVCDRLSDDIGIIAAISGRDLSDWVC